MMDIIDHLLLEQKQEIPQLIFTADYPNAYALWFL